LWLNLLTLTFLLSTPLILAAMGGLASERSGVINIGLEGLMLTSACVVCVVSVHMGPAVGLCAGLGVSVLLSLVHWVATQVYRIDHVISGMAINALAAGGTNYLFGRFGQSSTGPMPHFQAEAFAKVAVVLPFLIALYLARFRGGLRLLAVGNDPEKARLAGLNPVAIRFIALILTGIFSGLGGAMLVSYTGVFTDGMTAGRGYIALAALILGGWRPLPALAGCLAFGLLSAVRLQFQGVTVLGVQPPSQLWASLPYLATVVAMAGFVGRLRTPPGLGNY
jgi:simple sugar transport system permease protein